MRCDFETLCSYLNDELNARRRSEVDAHLRECEICFEAVCVMSEDRGGPRERAIQLPGEEVMVSGKYV
jgi:anti-sigma factor RsiW